MNEDKITVTKSFLPPKEEYFEEIQSIWNTGQLTTFGPKVLKLCEMLEERFDIHRMLFVTNGTVALQLALRALKITREVITTPFSYVATTSSILWEGAQPVFVDIDPNTFNIDPAKIEERITDRTEAILATHVFGNPCDVEAIDSIARKSGLQVIYDAAHAFDVKLQDKSIFQYGDISTCSFHATKVFHTIEGGAIFCKSEKMFDRVLSLSNFGHEGELAIKDLGINGKNCEFHAAMGLVNLPYVGAIIEGRKRVCERYDSLLDNHNSIRQTFPPEVQRNYAYYPVVFEDEKQLEVVIAKLRAHNIYPRRYFYPSLNRLPFLRQQPILRNSESISRRILCLPLYPNLAESNIAKICRIILDAS